jgi:hypothetical protein
MAHRDQEDELAKVEMSAGTRVYTADNIVHSIVIYEWASDITMLQVKQLFDRFSSVVGGNPDCVTVSEGSRSRQHKYPGFVKRDVINKQDWEALSYQWLREPDDLSGFSILCSLSKDRSKTASFHLDEAAVENAEGLMEIWVGEVSQTLRPTYGFMRSAAYKWQPNYYVYGYVMGPGRSDEMTRRADFGYVVRKANRELDCKFRDIYPVNLISEGHLAIQVEEMPLHAWIARGNRGLLEQIGEVTWKWSLKELELIRVRQAMLDGGHLIVSV